MSTSKNNCIYAHKSGLLALAVKVDNETVSFIDDGSTHAIDNINSMAFSSVSVAKLWIENKLPQCDECGTLLIGPDGPCENGSLCPNSECDVAVIG